VAFTVFVVTLLYIVTRGLDDSVLAAAYIVCVFLFLVFEPVHTGNAVWYDQSTAQQYYCTIAAKLAVAFFQFFHLKSTIVNRYINNTSSIR